MAYPVITGAILVEANGAAFNMAGQEERGRTGNVIVVKQIRVGRNRYPYISGQAWRRWLREVLYKDFDWKPSPVTREKKSAYTEGNPINYEEDDIFGYMAARKRAEKRNKKGAETEEAEATTERKGTFRRISPLKNSLLISVLPNVISEDFGHFSRNLQPGEDIIPFEHQHYTTPLQGTFTISLTDVGRFEVGEMRDLSAEFAKRYTSELTTSKDGALFLKKNARIKRVKDVLKALSRLRHGAQLARNLSDVNPVAVVIGFIDGGNAPFQNLFTSTPEGERAILNLKRFQSVLVDYQDRILNKLPILIGLRATVLADEENVKKAMEQPPFKELVTWQNSENSNEFMTPKEVLEEAAELVTKVFE